MEHMSQRLEASGVAMETDAEDLDHFEEKRVLLRLCQADAARQQANFRVALKHLKYTLKVCGGAY